MMRSIMVWLLGQRFGEVEDEAVGFALWIEAAVNASGGA